MYDELKHVYLSRFSACQECESVAEHDLRDCMHELETARTFINAAMCVVADAAPWRVAELTAILERVEGLKP